MTCRARPFVLTSPNELTSLPHKERERGDRMYEGKTLVPILCMHRSGSSLATNVLAELGMALGPFPLMGSTEFNRHGHFESIPFYELNQEIQRQALGFSEVYSRVFDAECKHHEAATVAHPSQAIFEQLAALPAQAFTDESAARTEADASRREGLVRSKYDLAAAELAATQTELAATRTELAATQTRLCAAEAEASQLATDLHLTKASRLWRIREVLVTLPALKQFANRPQRKTSSGEVSCADG
jgi:hypothetical protein